MRCIYHNHPVFDSFFFKKQPNILMAYVLFPDELRARPLARKVLLRQWLKSHFLTWAIENNPFPASCARDRIHYDPNTGFSIYSVSDYRIQTCVLRMDLNSMFHSQVWITHQWICAYQCSQVQYEFLNSGWEKTSAPPQYLEHLGQGCLGKSIRYFDLKSVIYIQP